MPSLCARICFLLALAHYAFAQAVTIPSINIDEKTYVRIQEHYYNNQIQTTEQARVTALIWDQTPAQVTLTVLDYKNVNGANVPLWRQWGLQSLFYQGLLEPDSCMTPVTPQDGLNSDFTTISFILPSGVAKLNTVGPDLYGVNKDLARAVSGIFGIQGTLEVTDYAYTDGYIMRHAFQEWRRENRYSPAPLRFPAERGDGVKLYLTSSIPREYRKLLGYPSISEVDHLFE